MRTWQVASVAIFAPLLTASFFKAKHVAVGAYSRAMGVRSKLRWGEAASEAAAGAALSPSLKRRLDGRLRAGKLRIVTQAAAEEAVKSASGTVQTKLLGVTRHLQRRDTPG